MRRKVQVWIWARVAGGIQVLLLRTNSRRGAFWQPVTGGVEDGESFEAAALREAREETGLEFPTRPEPIGYAFHFESQWGPADEEAFSLEAPTSAVTPGKIRLDPSEHDDCRWLGADEALGQLKWPSNQEALRILLARLGALK